MKLYLSTKYNIVKGVSFEKNIIYDKRVKENIKIEKPYDINVVKNIFQCKSIQELLDSNIDKENIKLNIELLYDLDIIQIKSTYYKKIFYHNNLIEMYVLATLYYFFRYVPLYLF